MIRLLLRKTLLIVLFGAALNLSFQAGLPKIALEEHAVGGTFIEAKSIYLLPFREKEYSQGPQFTYSLQTLSYSLSSFWSACTQSDPHLQLFYRSGKHLFKEYPFNILVRNLRI